MTNWVESLPSRASGGWDEPRISGAPNMPERVVVGQPGVGRRGNLTLEAMICMKNKELTGDGRDQHEIVYI